ncbi:MAG: hypothetical protein AB1505_16695 [Candidatus Latescibacterota bacterium]
MAHSYTPGLRVARQAVIRRERRLPLRGQVLVARGDAVRRDQVVARTDLPGEIVTLNLVNRLGVSPRELPGYMLKREGEAIAEGETLAQTHPLIRWFRRTVESPANGTVESISSVTGQVMLRRPARPVEVLAYVDGGVVEVLPEEGVVVEASGAFVQGIFGVGGERWGELRLLATAPEEVVPPERVDGACAGRVLVAGSLLTLALIQHARQAGAAGVIGGGIGDRDLRELLGRDLGVAITGTEEIGLTVIVTEGFGRIQMARRTFDLLGECAGRQASISGATQIRAGVLRPEIIVPAGPPARPEEAAPASARSGLGEGDLVRVIRVPYFGRIGRVAALPSQLQQVECGSRVRVLTVEFEDGERATVPRANVEAIEE